MSLDSTLRFYAQRAVHGMGQAVTLSRVTVGAYSTATGTATNTTTEYPLVARIDKYLNRELSSTIHAGDRKVILAAADLDFEPLETDQLTIGEIPHEVVDVATDWAAKLPAMYTLQARPIGG